MDKEDALIVFEEHIRTAEKHYLKEKDMEERRRRRQERKIREAFQAYLMELHKRGWFIFCIDTNIIFLVVYSFFSKREKEGIISNSWGWVTDCNAFIYDQRD